MYIKSIELHNFRNYEALSLQFDKNLNLILGKNAQGKTNLIEAIYFTSLGKSFRTTHDQELIRFGEKEGSVLVDFENENGDGTVEIRIGGDSKKTAKVDGVKIRRASELMGNVYAVAFSPEDLKIVKDEPDKRRRFIDKELCQIRPSYYENLVNYKKVLAQRNAYLKEEVVDKDALDVWDRSLAHYGAAITIQRAAFIEKLSKISGEIHKNITAGAENLTVKYAPNLKLFDSITEEEEYFYEKLKKNFAQDLKMRTSFVGPHKDDIEFFIGDIDVRSFGSQGQQRTVALSLKLSEIKILEEETGEKPILLLDDVMSELDGERQKYLIKTLSDVQLFITTTEISDDILKEFPKGDTYHIKNGLIEA